MDGELHGADWFAVSTDRSLRGLICVSAYDTNLAGIPARLARAYSAITRGLHYPGSEADAPYRPFRAGFDANADLTEETFRQAARLAPWWNIRIEPADAWFDTFENAKAQDDDAAYAEEMYRHLGKAMRATLAGPMHHASVWNDASAGYRDTRHYIFGRVPTGGLAGLVAFSVET